MPCIAFFDEHNFKILHGISAGTFFLCTGLYSIWIEGEFSHHADKFPECQQEISRLTNMKNIMVSALVGLIISAIFGGSHYWTTPFLEWFVVLLYLNFFGVLCLTNPFYETIHPYGKIVSNKQEQITA